MTFINTSLHHYSRLAIKTYIANLLYWRGLFIPKP